jgi:hypothetical protein
VRLEEQEQEQEQEDESGEKQLSASGVRGTRCLGRLVLPLSRSILKHPRLTLRRGQKRPSRKAITNSHPLGTMLDFVYLVSITSLHFLPWLFPFASFRLCGEFQAPEQQPAPRKKRVSRQGVKLAKDRSKRGMVCGIIGLAPRIGEMHLRKKLLGLDGRSPDAADWYPSYQRFRIQKNVWIA